MHNKTKLTIDMLSAISGVLIFLSVAHLIDLNGYGELGIPIFILGVVLLYWNEPFAKTIPIDWIREPVILTVSHVLIFLGIKTYLTAYTEQYWIIYLGIGVILLNKNRFIAEKVFRGK